MTTEQRESQRLLTVPEVAERLRLSKGTVYKLIRTEVLPAVQLGANGSSLRVRSDELEAWLEADA
jgi:excisionase family DNA binding protein